MAALCLQCVIFGAAMKPVTANHSKAVELDNMDVEKKKEEEAAFVSVTDMEIQDGASDDVGGASSTWVAYKKLARNVPFLLIMLGNLPAVMGLYIPYVFLPSMATERDILPEEASLLISLVGIFQTAGRLISGAIADHPKMDPLAMTCVSLALGATCPFFMIFCHSFVSFVAVSVFFGLSLSAWVAVSSPMLVDLLGLELLTTAFGILTCIRGVAAFLGPPTGGFAVDATVDPNIKDDSGDYTVAFWISSVLLALSAVVHCVAWCVKRSKSRNN